MSVVVRDVLVDVSLSQSFALGWRLTVMAMRRISANTIVEIK